MNIFDLEYNHTVTVDFEGDAVEYFDYSVTFKNWDNIETSKVMSASAIEEMADSLRAMAAKLEKHIGGDE